MPESLCLRAHTYLRGVTGAAGYCPNTPPTSLRFETFVLCYKFLASKIHEPTTTLCKYVKKTSLLLHFDTRYHKESTKFLSI